MHVLAGTKINWCASLRTPDHVCREWAEQHGLPLFGQDGDFGASLDVVCARLSVRTCSERRGSNAALFTALEEMGACIGVHLHLGARCCGLPVVA